MLAKEATTEEPDRRILVPAKDWRNLKKEEMKERTRERIEAEGRWKGVKYFNTFYETNKKKPWFDKRNTDRKQQ